jgi:hypothetical protein
MIVCLTETRLIQIGGLRIGVGDVHGVSLCNTG